MSSYCRDAYVNVRVSLKTFRNGLELFESNESDNAPLMEERSMRHINGVLTEECWYIFEGVIRKVVWSEERLVKTPGDLRECPMEILKTLFKEFATQVCHFAYYKMHLFFRDNLLIAFSSSSDSLKAV